MIQVFCPWVHSRTATLFVEKNADLTREWPANATVTRVTPGAYLPRNWLARMAPAKGLMGLHKLPFFNKDVPTKKQLKHVPIRYVITPLTR
jgi:hypothetical protein